MEEIKRLKEKREIEATLKKLSSKMQFILQNIGHPIVSHSTDAATYYDNEAWMTEGERTNNKGNGLDTMNEEDSGYCVGYVYDTLHMGKNVEMKYMVNERELKASFNGYTVYKEIEGVLHGYAPNEAWESVIESAYKRAKLVEESKSKQDREERQKQAVKKANSFIQRLRETWGF